MYIILQVIQYINFSETAFAKYFTFEKVHLFKSILVFGESLTETWSFSVRTVAEGLSAVGTAGRPTAIHYRAPCSTTDHS